MNMDSSCKVPGARKPSTYHHRYQCHRTGRKDTNVFTPRLTLRRCRHPRAHRLCYSFHRTVRCSTPKIVVSQRTPLAGQGLATVAVDGTTRGITNITGGHRPHQRARIAVPEPRRARQRQRSGARVAAVAGRNRRLRPVIFYCVEMCREWRTVFLSRPQRRHQRLRRKGITYDRDVVCVIDCHWVRVLQWARSTLWRSTIYDEYCMRSTEEDKWDTSSADFVIITVSSDIIIIIIICVWKGHLTRQCMLVNVLCEFVRPKYSCFSGFLRDVVPRQSPCGSLLYVCMWILQSGGSREFCLQIRQCTFNGLRELETFIP